MLVLLNITEWCKEKLHKQSFWIYMFFYSIETAALDTCWSRKPSSTHSHIFPTHTHPDTFNQCWALRGDEAHKSRGRRNKKRQRTRCLCTGVSFKPLTKNSEQDFYTCVYLRLIIVLQGQTVLHMRKKNELFLQWALSPDQSPSMCIWELRLHHVQRSMLPLQTHRTINTRYSHNTDRL